MQSTVTAGRCVRHLDKNPIALLGIGQRRILNTSHKLRRFGSSQLKLRRFSIKAAFGDENKTLTAFAVESPGADALGLGLPAPEILCSQ